MFSTKCHIFGVILAGASVVLLYASKYHNVRTVVNLSGRHHLERGMDDRLGEAFLEKIKRDGFIDGITNPGLYLTCG